MRFKICNRIFNKFENLSKSQKPRGAGNFFPTAVFIGGGLETFAAQGGVELLEVLKNLGR